MEEVSSVFSGKLNILVNNAGKNIRKATLDYTSVLSVSTYTIYSASKAALNQITKNLACEWAKDNIRANAVAPWYTRTSLVEHVLADKKFMDDTVSRTPLKRVAEPEEVSSLFCAFQQHHMSLDRSYVVMEDLLLMVSSLSSTRTSSLHQQAMTVSSFFSSNYFIM